MPRSARFVIPGYLYHVTQRGNYRQKVFGEDQDRAVYLKHIQENSKQWKVEIYAYCLMDNHVHFIVKPCCPNSLARLFSIAHMKYSHYFNKKHKRKGHLWQGRFFHAWSMGIISEKPCATLNAIRCGLRWSMWIGNTAGHRPGLI